MIPTDRRRHRLLVAALGLGTAVLVFAVAETVFPYHTSNHDEAVYLQQAAMLLEGQLFLRPPVPEAFRPWFFVVDGDAMYPKYAPVPAAMFALGKLLGGYRVALALIAGGCAFLTYRVGRELFDPRTGLLAGVVLVTSPLFLLQASVFLPYVPTLLLNLTFAAAYLRADRTGSLRTAGLAGLAVGLAFFARPYSAVLFATPFVAHALWTLRSGDRAALARQTVTAIPGLAGVAAALGYNAVVTGDPFLFPYEAFAPLDGLGFGRREILGYSIEYTPALALRANAEVLGAYLTRWAFAGVIGPLAAVLGLLAVARRRFPDGSGLTARRAAVAGVGLTVSLGNLYFWGNRNVLGTLDEAGDGLIGFLGPYYHVDLLVPTAIFGAVGLRFAWSRARAALARRPAWSDRAALAVLVVLSGIVGAAAMGMAAAPLSENAEVTDRYERAYEPFGEREFDDALVFLPTPYGDWLGHPFQALRNDPGYDGDVVYAMRERQFDVVDALPNRTIYRYTYRGPWSPTTGATVDPHLQRVHHASGPTVEQEVRASVPEAAELVSIRLSNGQNRTAETVSAANLSLTLAATDDAARLRGDGLDGNLSVPVDGRDTVELTLFVDYGTGAGFRYRFEQPIDARDGRVRVLTPYAEVCRGADLCGGESAYVPGEHYPEVGIELPPPAAGERR